jgi:SAM-dependent methyltransferase
MSSARYLASRLAATLGVERQARSLHRTAQTWSRSARFTFEALGWSPAKTRRALLYGHKYVTDARRYARLAKSRSTFRLNVGEVYPILGEHLDSAGTASGHYFHQDLWAAREVFRRRPSRHVDVGSRIDGFVAHLLTFMPVTVVDVRPLDDTVEGLHFIRSDATTLEGLETNSIESLSSLHAVEHFGLGRYGDRVEPAAAWRAMSSLARVLRPGGVLLFSVPIGRERVVFNAHRVFAPESVPLAMSSLQLVSFSAVDDSGRLVVDCAPSDFGDADYACGLYVFMKPASASA